MKSTRILAAVDRFPEDDAVLVRGREIAARHGVALTIVHVVDLPDHAAAPALINTLRGQAEYAARDRIEAALRRHEIDPTDTEILIKTGSPALRLVEICDVLRPALVVMRAHHKPWVIKRLPGSTTEKMIAAGSAPVLVVRQAVGKPYGRVLLAIDGPENAPTALSFVADLLLDAALHMVQAVEVSRQLEEAMLCVGMAQTNLSAHRDAPAHNAESSLSALAAELAPRVTWQVRRGEPATELVRATHDTDVDLIALGPNRSGLLRCAFIGSVTRRLLRDAACDVLVCRPLAAHTSGVIELREPAADQSTTISPQLSIEVTAMTTTPKQNPQTKDAKTDISNTLSVTDALTEVLTDTYRLVLKSHTYHWNVTGPLFFSIHEMTEEQYTDMFAAADVLAERIRALGKPALVSPAGLAAGPERQHPDASLAADEMVKDLLSDHEKLAKRMRALVETAETTGDPATVDVATERAAFHEKAAWMLRATAA